MLLLTFFLQVYPEGFRKLLNWIKNHYNNVPIFVTENGYSDLSGLLEDTGRQSYYHVRLHISNFLGNFTSYNFYP